MPPLSTPRWLTNLQDLFSKVGPPPDEWFEGIRSAIPERPSLPPLECDTYTDLVEAWKASVTWSDTLDVAFSAMLSVVASTQLQDDQLWLRIIGIPGTLKTTFCEAITAAGSEFTFPVSIQTGFHSGQEGCNLIQLIDGKTIVWNEGDTLLTAPNRDSTISQIRDFYSGNTRATYRNGVSYSFTGLRCSFLLAGTPTIRKLNRSAAGDRFLDVIIYKRRTEAEERQLVRDALNQSSEASITESNGQVDTKMSPELTVAFRKTAGYVKRLRRTVNNRLREMRLNGGIPASLTDDVESLGRLIALMRARPGAGEEDVSEAELHIRLAKQLRKLAQCLPLVMDLPSIDSEVMRRVAQIARDTCHGRTFDIVNALSNGPLASRAVAIKLHLTDTKVQDGLNILHSLGCVNIETEAPESGARNRSVAYRLHNSTVALITYLRRLLHPKVPVHA